MEQTSPLDRHAIQSLLTTRHLGRRIELRGHIGSTNRDAFALARADAEHGTVVLADAQAEGRGRLSREWFSPPGVNIYCSVVIRTQPAADSLTGWLSWLPLITALAGAESIERIAPVAVSVKWPNDLLIDDRKVGGVLCESSTSARSGPFQVVGIGVNVNGRREDFPESLRKAATSIREETGKIANRNLLVAQLLNTLEHYVEEFLSRGSESIAPAYQRRCSTIGRTVKVTFADGKEVVGLAEGLGPDGSLKVVERPIQPEGRAPVIQEVRAADIVHLRA